MGKMKLAAGLLLALALVACASGPPIIGGMTPKQQVTMAMEIYAGQEAAYLVAVAQPDLSPAKKEYLMKKKSALVEAHRAIAAYDRYVLAGQIPPADIEALLIKAIDKLTKGD
jgi:uncharacterized protein YcfL